jgi:hypothetical protein
MKSYQRQIGALRHAVDSLKGAEFSAPDLRALRTEEKRLRSIIDTAQANRNPIDQEAYVTNERLAQWLSMTPDRASRSASALSFLKERQSSEPVLLFDLAKALGWLEHEPQTDPMTDSRRKLEGLKDGGLISAYRSDDGQWSYALTERGHAFMDSPEFLSLRAIPGR